MDERMFWSHEDGTKKKNTAKRNMSSSVWALTIYKSSYVKINFEVVFIFEIIYIFEIIFIY